MWPFKKEEKKNKLADHKKYFEKYFPEYVRFHDPQYWGQVEEDASQHLLTTPSRDYVSSQGKELSDYVQRGVTSQVEIPLKDWLSLFVVQESLLKKMRTLEAEVVTDVKYNHSSCWGAFGIHNYSVLASGTALILKKV
ncbi:MAG: hypothetical protein V2A62_00625 [Candidatus Woesearchaeota archaeon]